MASPNNSDLYNLQNILDHLPLGVVSFNLDGELLSYNNYLKNLWKVEEDFLQGNPLLIEFFEVLRERKVYPEKDNFRAYCNNLLQILRSPLNYNQKQHLLLPNGKSLQETLIKDSRSLTFIWEDTTDSWDITYSLNNYKNTYQRIIDKNPYPVVLVGSNGIIENYNGKFLEFYNISSDLIHEKYHIRDLLNFIFKEDHDETKAILIGNILSGRSFFYKYQIQAPSQIDLVKQSFNKILNTLPAKSKDLIATNKNEKATKPHIEELIEVHGIALPNSSMFIIFSNALPQILHKPTYLLEQSIDQLHNNFIVDLNHSIGAPLNTIMGFADLLANEYIGNLNVRQKDYVNKIIEQANFINTELNYKIMLSDFQSSTAPEIQEIDLDTIIANILHQTKPRIKLKNISLKLDFKNSLKPISSNEELLSKALSLIFLYLIEQNNLNAEMIFEISQEDKTTLTFKDTSKLPIFSQYDLKNRYDINLALKILASLKVKIDYFYKNRSHRIFTIFL
ncbi:hypothetical protein ABSA28_00040 [Candidatus Hepatincolaceae symbiont of Richtersius coronifer]